MPPFLKPRSVSTLHLDSMCDYFTYKGKTQCAWAPLECARTKSTELGAGTPALSFFFMTDMARLKVASEFGKPASARKGRGCVSKVVRAWVAALEKGRGRCRYGGF